MIRIGMLGAARIGPAALVLPARLLGGEVRVEAVAARDPARAGDFARRFGIARALASYQELAEDAGIDAVYNALPNSLHAEWSIRALQAGKHVLCEKPMACNALEAQQMKEAAARAGRILVEAFHYRCHPLVLRMKEIVAGGELGGLRHIEAHFCAPLWNRSDIRYRYELGGGATMDLGCYCINVIRFLAGAEPEVTGARALLASPQIDRFMEADFRFPAGATARMTCSLWSRVLLRTRVLVRGTKGELRVWFPFQPHFLHRLKVRSGGGTRVERFSPERSYAWQLRAFAAAVRGEGPVVTTAADAVGNMRVIDAVYAKAGLKPRGWQGAANK
jgi:predicted dehydrogenase